MLAGFDYLKYRPEQAIGLTPLHCESQTQPPSPLSIEYTIVGIRDLIFHFIFLLHTHAPLLPQCSLVLVARSPLYTNSVLVLIYDTYNSLALYIFITFFVASIVFY